MTETTSEPVPLFTAGELCDWLGRPSSTITDQRAKIIERVVWGWIVDATDHTDRPETVPAGLFSAAIELGAIAFENPAGLSAKQLGTSQQQFSSERRTEILDGLTVPRSDAGAVAGPQGSFPPAPAYPDPAVCPPRW